MKSLWRLLTTALTVTLACGPGGLFAQSPAEEETAYVEILDPVAMEGGAPARIKVHVPALPDRYHLEIRLEESEQLARRNDLDLPPLEVLQAIHDQPDPVLEIHAWDDVLAEESEWVTLRILIVGASASGQAGEKPLGNVRLRIIDNDLDAAFGRIGWYRWLRGYPYDYSGLANHGQIENVRFTESNGRAALVFSGEKDFVILSPALDKAETGGAPASGEAAPPGGLARYSYRHRPIQKSTLALWVRAKDTFAPQVLYEEGDTRNGQSLAFEKGDLIYSVATGSQVTQLNAAVDPDEWVHVAAVFDEGHLRLYINGVEWDTIQAPHPVIGFRPGAASLSRGSGQGPGSAQKTGFAGMIGETVIYDRALSPAQIRAIALQGAGEISGQE